MKRFVSLLVLVVCMATVMAQSQSYQMVIHVNDNMEGRFPEGKISIPVDKIREVTFEEISDIIIPDGKMPITFLFNDYTTPTRSSMRRAPALETRKYGVFACYNNGDAIGQEKVSANLMNNQKVTFIDGVWKYSPTINWPEKEEGSNYSSFFAYSPYSDSEFVSVNSESLEPVIDYYSSNPMDDNGDLLYGSLVNATKSDNNGCVSIQSRHALSRLSLKAVGAIDQVSAGASYSELGTKITIKSIKISGLIPNRGSFDLKEQQWKNLSQEPQTYTIEGDNLAADLRDVGDTFAANQPEGVTINSKPVGVSPFLLIPTDGEKQITIMVEYFITTDDPKLSTGYSRIRNVITKQLNFNMTAGYSYDLQIVLGLTSLKCSLSSSSIWDETSDINL